MAYRLLAASKQVVRSLATGTHLSSNVLRDIPDVDLDDDGVFKYILINVKNGHVVHKHVQTYGGIPPDS